MLVLLALVAAWHVATRGDETSPPDAPTPGGTIPTDAAATNAPPRADPARAERPVAPTAPTTEAATTATVVGRVTTASGASTEKAAVRLTPDGDEDRAVVVRCGADGAFRAEGLAPARWRVVVAGGGFATRLDVEGAEARFVDLAAGDEVRVDLVATPLAVLAGTVTDADGRPVAGATVHIQCDAFLTPQRAVWQLETTTSPDGRFERTSVTPGGSVRVEVAAPDAPRWTTHVSSLPAGVRTEVDVRLARGTRFLLSLRSAADAAAVHGALVWFEDAETGHSLTDDGVRTDEEGALALSVAEGRAVRLQLHAEGFVSIQSTVVQADAIRAGPVEIRMVPALAITGRVTYADGRPAARVEVQAMPPGDPMRGIHSSLEARATTDEEGRFRVAGLTAGRWAVAVLGSGWMPVEAVVADAGARDVHIALPAGAAPLREIRVRIAGAGAVPIDLVRRREGVHVEGDLGSHAGGALASTEHTIHVAAETHMTPFFEAWDARDASGRRLPLGHVYLDVPADVPEEWTVEMPPERVVEGRVVAADGTGVPGARIRVSSAIHGRAFGELDTVTTGADGTFRVGGLGSGDYVLAASTPGHAVAQVAARGGATGVEIRLAAGARATVRVVDAEGAPVPGASVYLRASDAPEDRFDLSDPEDLETDSEGRVSLPGLPAGVPHDLRVHVMVSGHEDGYFPAELNRWMPADVEIRLERQLRVEGVVRLPDGRPLPGCVVSAVGDGERRDEIHVRPGIAPGTFVLRELRAGQKARVRATAGDAASQEMTVEAGRRDVVLVFDAGAWFSVRFTDPHVGSFDSMHGGGGARMWWFPGGRSVALGDDEVLTVGGLEPRVRYTVVVGPTWSGHCAEVRDVVADGRTVDVALAAGLPIAGRIVVEAGRTLDRDATRVEATRDGAVIETARTGDGGRFRFPGLPAGRWTLRAVVDGTTGPLATAEVDAGDGDVTLAAAGR